MAELPPPAGTDVPGAAVDWIAQVVEVSDPDNFYAPPIYTGPADQAAQWLEPGAYLATVPDSEELDWTLLIGSGRATTLTPMSPEMTQWRRIQSDRRELTERVSQVDPAPEQHFSEFSSGFDPAVAQLRQRLWDSESDLAAQLRGRSDPEASYILDGLDDPYGGRAGKVAQTGDEDGPEDPSADARYWATAFVDQYTVELMRAGYPNGVAVAACQQHVDTHSWPDLQDAVAPADDPESLVLLASLGAAAQSVNNDTEPRPGTNSRWELAADIYLQSGAPITRAEAELAADHHIAGRPHAAAVTAITLDLFKSGTPFWEAYSTVLGRDVRSEPLVRVEHSGNRTEVHLDPLLPMYPDLAWVLQCNNFHPVDTTTGTWSTQTEPGSQRRSQFRMAAFESAANTLGCHVIHHSPTDSQRLHQLNTSPPAIPVSTAPQPMIPRR